MVSAAVLLLQCQPVVGQAPNVQAESKRAFTEEEVSFKTEDGWMIRGVLRVPSMLGQEKVAAVVLVPSPHHDRDTYGNNGYPSARSVLETDNIATLIID